MGGTVNSNGCAAGPTGRPPGRRRPHAPLGPQPARGPRRLRGDAPPPRGRTHSHAARRYVAGPARGRPHDAWHGRLRAGAAGEAARGPSDHRPLGGGGRRGRRSALSSSTPRTTSPSRSTPTSSWPASSASCARRDRQPQSRSAVATWRSTSPPGRLPTPAATHQLTPTEARLLQVLAAAVDRVVPTDELLNRVWTDADGADPSTCG